MAGKQAKSGRAGKAEKLLWICHCGKEIKGLAEGLDHTSKCDAEQKAAHAAKDRQQNCAVTPPVHHAATGHGWPRLVARATLPAAPCEPATPATRQAAPAQAPPRVTHTNNRLAPPPLAQMARVLLLRAHRQRPAKSPTTPRIFEVESPPRCSRSLRDGDGPSPATPSNDGEVGG
ncbi:hypothetical protein ZWY2020_021922 [Hordeum vulgare]|nr:hypothetical protein ZWY2020_021922 [Hordeum vulgare]